MIKNKSFFENFKPILKSIGIHCKIILETVKTMIWYAISIIIVNNLGDTNFYVPPVFNIILSAGIYLFNYYRINKIARYD